MSTVANNPVVGSIAARLERLPHSRWHVKVRVLIGAVTFFEAFDQLLAASALPVLMDEWNLSTGQATMAVTTGSIGMLFGALGGRLARRPDRPGPHRRPRCRPDRPRLPRRGHLRQHRDVRALPLPARARHRRRGPRRRHVHQRDRPLRQPRPLRPPLRDDLPGRTLGRHPGRGLGHPALRLAGHVPHRRPAGPDRRPAPPQGPRVAPLAAGEGPDRGGGGGHRADRARGRGVHPRAAARTPRRDPRREGHGPPRGPLQGPLPAPHRRPLRPLVRRLLRQPRHRHLAALALHRHLRPRPDHGADLLPDQQRHRPARQLPDGALHRPDRPCGPP